jgi:hypothetical protein
MGIHKYTEGSTYDIYLPYICLGVLLLFPGVYYTFILVNVLLGREDYEYTDLPDLSD